MQPSTLHPESPDTRPAGAAEADTAPARRSWPWRIGRRAGRALAVVLVLALTGTTAQAVAERRDAQEHPAPGELVELPDGRMLHLEVAGEEHDGPTVVLEGGAGASTAAWGWVLPVIAEHATVVAYDRAGLGWSDPGGNGPAADAVIADLRAALDARGLPGPYILVGHSLGGHYARAFAEAHPDEVAGIVLVDPSHERASEVLGASPEDSGPVFALLTAATRLGLLRLHNPFEDEVRLLPQPQRDQALAQMVTVGYARSFGAEMTAVDRVGARLDGEAGALGDVPLRVLVGVGGASDADEERVVEGMAHLRVGLADLSSRGEAIVLPDAAHVGIVTDQAHARVVSSTILDVLAAAGR